MSKRAQQKPTDFIQRMSRCRGKGARPKIKHQRLARERLLREAEQAVDK